MKPFLETKDDIRRILAKHGAALGYVFGSYAAGKTGPLSDVDVAVVFEKDIPRDEFFDRELQIAGDIGDFLKIDRVDVVNLVTVSDPLLKHRAVFFGAPVLAQNPRHRFQVERHVMQEYEDTRHLRENMFRLMSRRLRDGTFGTAGI